MWNYGKESQGRPFKKGHRPWNTLPVGAERVSSAGFVQVKVAQPNRWRPKHTLVWEKPHGPIPEGHKIEFIDGDRQNVCLENLKLTPTGARIGDERVGSNGLIEVKTVAGRWRPKHVLTWEAAHGVLPKTHVLYFIDGDISNCALDNLYPFPKNGRLTVIDLARLCPGSGLEDFSLSIELMDRVMHQTGHRAALEALKISDALRFAQVEFLQMQNGGPDVPRRH